MKQAKRYKRTPWLKRPDIAEFAQHLADRMRARIEKMGGLRT